MIKIVLWIIPVLWMTSCAHEPLEEGTRPPPKIAEAPDQGGQLPLKVAQQASDQHGGSMVSTAGQTGDTGPSPDSTGTVGKGITVVLGPVSAERLEEGTSKDAGQSIREIISQRLTGSRKITLLDAPEERFIDDSPRPDLARKGISYVIKGIASHGSDSKEVTVFLRAVDTMTGKVAMVASARNLSLNSAADEAADRLLAKITGAEQ